MRPMFPKLNARIGLKKQKSLKDVLFWQDFSEKKLLEKPLSFFQCSKIEIHARKNVDDQKK